MIEYVTTDDFDVRVLMNDRPTIVEFCADWCPYCAAIEPTVDELAEKYKDEIDTFRVNVDTDGVLRAEYKVEYIPDVLFFKDGQQVDECMGNDHKQFLPGKIEKMLGRA
ncbi:MAG: thioredoxin family protein [Eubacteriales bacterium]|nr:thioredoxin family protein [Eubacteriales bacterium]